MAAATARIRGGKLGDGLEAELEVAIEKGFGSFSTEMNSN